MTNPAEPLAHPPLRYDWTLSAVALFHRLSKAGDAPEAVKLLVAVGADSPVDLLLVYEFAVCDDNAALVEAAAAVLEARNLRVPIEIWLRIALWPGVRPAHLAAYASLVKPAPAHPDKLVQALVIAAGESPAAFKRALRYCPQPSPSTPLTQAGARAILSAAWDAEMLHDVVNSWVDDAHPGEWASFAVDRGASSPMSRPATRTAALQDVLTKYRRSVGGAPLALEASRFDYRPTSALAKRDDTDKEPPVPTLRAALANFDTAGYGNLGAPPTFGLVKACTNPAHPLCRALVPRRTELGGEQ